MPVRFKFLCVLQSLILNPGGSPPPGANECLIKIILFPSCAKFQVGLMRLIVMLREKGIDLLLGK